MTDAGIIDCDSPYLVHMTVSQTTDTNCTGDGVVVVMVTHAVSETQSATFTVNFLIRRV